jgi:hypothetical protein
LKHGREGTRPKSRAPKILARRRLDILALSPFDW